MLVLSRKLGEEIIIGDEIRVVVSRISGNRVSIGIIAPEKMPIVRGELIPTTRRADAPAVRDALVAV